MNRNIGWQFLLFDILGKGNNLIGDVIAWQFFFTTFYQRIDFIFR